VTDQNIRRKRQALAADHQTVIDGSTMNRLHLVD
jgi:hypothetical protein